MFPCYCARGPPEFMCAGTGNVTTLGKSRSKPHLWALLYIELTSNAHDTSLSLSSFPFWQKSELNSTCVIIRNPSSFVNASGPAVTASRAETKQRGPLHGSSYRQGWRRVLKVSHNISSFQICHGGGRESKARLNTCWYTMCVEPVLSRPEGRIVPDKFGRSKTFSSHFYFSLINSARLTKRSERIIQVETRRSDNPPRIHLVFRCFIGCFWITWTHKLQMWSKQNINTVLYHITPSCDTLTLVPNISIKTVPTSWLLVAKLKVKFAKMQPKLFFVNVTESKLHVKA